MKARGNMDLMPLSISAIRKIPQDSYLLIDVRPRAEFNLKHIVSSVNIHCSPLLLRRYQRGNKPADNLLLSEDVRRQFQIHSCHIFVLYDNDSTGENVGKEVRQMASILRSLKRTKSLFFLEGKFITIAPYIILTCK